MTAAIIKSMQPWVKKTFGHHQFLGALAAFGLVLLLWFSLSVVWNFKKFPCSFSLQNQASFQQTESNLLFFVFYGIFCVNPLPGKVESPNPRLHGSNISTNATFEDLKHSMAISRSLKHRAIGGLNTEDQMSSESWRISFFFFPHCVRQIISHKCLGLSCFSRLGAVPL